MKCTVEMGSGVVMCIPIFKKIGSGSQKLFEGTHMQHTESKVVS
jgi:hypothetical protein